MNAVKVKYIVKEEYVETNKANIQQVMADLRELNNPDIKYVVWPRPVDGAWQVIVLRKSQLL